VLGHARDEEVDLALPAPPIAPWPLVGSDPVDERLGEELLEGGGHVLRGVDPRPAVLEGRRPDHRLALGSGADQVERDDVLGARIAVSRQHRPRIAAASG
jgi:hypothetical protein